MLSTLCKHYKILSLPNFDYLFNQMNFKTQELMSSLADFSYDNLVRFNTSDEFYDLVNQWHYDKQEAEEAAASEEESSSSSDDSSSNEDDSDWKDHSYETEDGGVVTNTGSHRATYSPWSWKGY